MPRLCPGRHGAKPVRVPHIVSFMGDNMANPLSPATRLSRDEAAKALTEAGFPIKKSTLATLASRGGGPLYTVFNGRVFYEWGDALSWAQGRTSPPMATASEGRASIAAA